VNKQLHEQLKSPQARVRHQAIVKLARIKDEDVLPLLNDISKNDPEPSLRQLAERAINHILNEFSSTMSRSKAQETPPSKIPPFSNPEAERHIQRAYQAYEDGSTANALQYLIKALDMTPMLVGDFDVQLLAENLTGIEGAVAAKMLTDPEKRKNFFDNDLPSSGNFPISPSLIIIFMLFLVVSSQFYLSDGVEFINRAFDEIEMQQLKRSVRQINGVDYYVIAPSNKPNANGYPMLVALPDGQEDSTAMLRYFSEFTNLYDTILLVPNFTDYRLSQIEGQTSALQLMIDSVSREYAIDADGAVLFGFGDGASVATQYANYFPEYTASVITSGGTFLYPRPETVPYTIIYGADDTLLRDRTENDVPFADLTQWAEPLNYLTIENIGHEVNIQQIDITKQVLLDVYQ